MEWFETPAAVSAWSDAQHRAGRTIGFVPTMGYLHDGHASLMRLLRPNVDRLLVSIYVNPKQFAAHEDLDTYPRDLDHDRAVCAAAGVDAIFAPTGSLYPPGYETSVKATRLSTVLDGEHRPHFFEGVATVCTRLFGITRADYAAFGEKDYQQLVILRRVVEDLALPVRIVPGPLVRARDGLALSSRNAYLSDAERLRARSLYRALQRLAVSVEAGGTDVAALVNDARRRLDVDQLDYLALVDPDTLEPMDTVDRPARALVAGWVGRTRLLDNLAVHPPGSEVR